MKEIGNVWNDLKNRNFIEAYLVVLASIIILAADLLGFSTASVMENIILSLLAILVYFSILERREFRKIGQVSEIEGITAFRVGRQRIPLLDEFIKRAKTEIVFYSVQHSTLVHLYLGLLRTKVESGCRVKILVLSSKGPDQIVNPNALAFAANRTQDNFTSRLEPNTQALVDWRRSLPIPIQTSVEIKSYWEAPPVSYTFVDRNSSEGFGLVEIFLPKVDLYDLPHYVVTRKENGSFFDIHSRSFDAIWERSQAIDLA